MTSARFHGSSSEHHNASECDYWGTFRLPGHFSAVVSVSLYSWKVYRLRIQDTDPCQCLFSGRLQPALRSRCVIANIVARREFISTEDGKVHAERSLVLAQVKEQLLILLQVKRMSDDTHPKDLAGDDREGVHIPHSTSLSNLIKRGRGRGSSNSLFQSREVCCTMGLKQTMPLSASGSNAPFFCP
jgi:hypothetical protein